MPVTNTEYKVNGFIVSVSCYTELTQAQKDSTAQLFGGDALAWKARQEANGTWTLLGVSIAFDQ